MEPVSNLVLKYCLEKDTHDEFNKWHALKHIPSRIGLPGFSKVQRWKSKRTPSHYLCIYHLRSSNALNSPEYQKLAAQPPDEEESTLEDAFLLEWRAECTESIKDTGLGGGSLILIESDASLSNEDADNIFSKCKYPFLNISKSDVVNLIYPAEKADIKTLLMIETPSSLSETNPDLLELLDRVPYVSWDIYNLDLKA